MSIGYALEKLRAVLNAKVIETAALAGPVLPLGRPVDAANFLENFLHNLGFSVFLPSFEW